MCVRRCAGCGSKVGSNVLTRAMKRVKAMNMLVARDEVLAGIGDDAAVLSLSHSPGACMVQTIDYFKSFVSDPFLFGKIAANHALSGDICLLCFV
jgi:selenide, water dikinase